MNPVITRTQDSWSLHYPKRGEGRSPITVVAPAPDPCGDKVRLSQEQRAVILEAANRHRMGDSNALKQCARLLDWSLNKTRRTAQALGYLPRIRRS